MKFRPCIDIHNGKVKQIVGGSLKDAGNQAQENFVSEQDAAFYASLYKEKGLKGGHIILLNSADSAIRVILLISWHCSGKIQIRQTKRSLNIYQAISAAVPDIRASCVRSATI